MTDTLSSHAYTAPQPGPQQLKHRRWMRGLSIFFVCIGVLATLGGLLSVSGASDKYPVDYGIGMLVIGICYIAAALMGWNGSRLAAPFLLVWVLADYAEGFAKIDAAFIAMSVRNLFYIGLIALLAWHAHKYHKTARAAGVPIGGSAFIRWGGAVLFLLLGSVVMLGLWVNTSGIPTKIVSGDGIPEDQITWMQENDFLTKGETPLLFYSEGIMSISEGGNLLTDKYIGAWWQDAGNLDSSWFKLGEVCDFEQIVEGSFFEDAVYTVHDTDKDNYVQLWLSTEEGLHAEFIRRAKYLNERNMDPDYKTVCDSGEPIDWDAFSLARGIQPGLVTSEALPDAHRKWLLEQKFLLPDENIKWFYSYGRYDISDGGVLLTDEYFGGWYQQAYEPRSIWRKLGAICSVSDLPDGDTKTSTRHRINLPNEETFSFSLPIENEQNLDFISHLKTSNAERMTSEDRETCEAPSEPPAEPNSPAASDP